VAHREIPRKARGRWVRMLARSPQKIESHFFWPESLIVAAILRWRDTARNAAHVRENARVAYLLAQRAAHLPSILP
jgi:hypothetical protein